MSLMCKLHKAIENNNYEQVLNILLHNQLDINAVFGRDTACTKAITNKNTLIINQIISIPHFDPNAPDKTGRTPLYIAALYGNVQVMDYLIKHGSELEKADLKGMTALGAAAFYDHAKAAEMLIHAGAIINAQDNSGETPLLKACSNGSHNVVRVLLKHGCDVNLPTNENHLIPGMTPLMISVASKYFVEIRKKSSFRILEIIRDLIRYHCDIDASCWNGMTAVHRAVETDELFAVVCLAEHGCNMDKMDSNGFNALCRALQPGQEKFEIASFLIAYGCDMENVFQFLLFHNSPILHKELSMSAQKPFRDELVPLLCNSLFGSASILNDAMTHNTIDHQYSILQKLQDNIPPSLQHIVRFSIRKFLRNNVFNKIEKLPIPWPLKKYLSLDFDYIKYHPYRSCLLQTLVIDESLVLIRNLVENGLDVNVIINGQTALINAVRLGLVHSTKLLLDLGADPFILDSQGQTALHLASMTPINQCNIIAALLAANVDVNLKNADGSTALAESARNGCFINMDYLLDNGANPHVQDRFGFYPIHYASGGGCVMAVEKLLQAGVCPSFPDWRGNTPLHIAASKGQVYKKLGIKPLAFYSQYANYHHVILVLIKAGCSSDLRNIDEKTAYDYASEYGLLNSLFSQPETKTIKQERYFCCE